MFSEEQIALVPKVNEAIKKIAKRQERKCPECKGMGLDLPDPETLDVGMRVPACPTCNGTGKVKGKWEWEPEVGESYLVPELNRIRVIVEVKGNFLFYVYRYNGGKMDIGNTLASMVIPLLHWERIERILEGMGYTVRMSREDLGKQGAYCEIYQFGQLKDYVEVRKGGKSRQEAVQRVVIELAKEKANEKD